MCFQSYFQSQVLEFYRWFVFQEVQSLKIQSIVSKLSIISNILIQKMNSHIFKKIINMLQDLHTFLSFNFFLQLFIFINLSFFNYYNLSLL